MKLGKTVEEM
ncbi:Protein of unknown function [Bacillus mycoides]|nr:Protein of unknown function [Bacillus mycoides]